MPALSILFEHSLWRLTVKQDSNSYFNVVTTVSATGIGDISVKSIHLVVL